MAEHRFGLRLPLELYDYLVGRAQEHDRSINAEIVAILNEIRETGQWLGEAEQRLRETEQRLRETEQRDTEREERLDNLEQMLLEIRTVMATSLPNMRKLTRDMEAMAAERQITVDDLYRETVRQLIERIDREKQERKLKAG
jgi:hypothetical protein